MILIAGAGISGLSLAFQLKRKGLSFLLIDTEEIAGGKIRSIRKDGFAMDTGPNTLLADEVVLNFLKEAGLGEDIVYPLETSKNRFIFRNARFHGLSSSPFSLLFSPLLSFNAKRRILLEQWQKSNGPENESFAAFVRRRFGQEVLDWLACPVQYGIHAADPDELLMEDAFPKITGLERMYGSVLRGLGKTKGVSRAKTLSFRGGMQTLSDKLAAQLAENIRFNYSLQEIKWENSVWNCEFLCGEKTIHQSFSELFFCMPASDAANILARSGYARPADALKKIKYHSLSVSHMAFAATEKKEFQGFGGLVPPAAGFETAGAIWASSIFPDRAPVGFHLLAGFYGGALQPEVSGKSAEEISALLQAENKILYGREALFFPNVTIWKNAIPSYDFQRKRALEELENCTPPGIRFLANWKAGIGLADCIRNAIKISESI